MNLEEDVEAAVAYFKILSKNLQWQAVENHEKLLKTASHLS
jgi:hypothetical protein